MFEIRERVGAKNNPAHLFISFPYYYCPCAFLYDTAD